MSRRMENYEENMELLKKWLGNMVESYTNSQTIPNSPNLPTKLTHVWFDEIL